MKYAVQPLYWALALACASASAPAQDRPPVDPHTTLTAPGPATSAVDNTRVNARDKGTATKTPQTQPNNAEDRALLAAVRQAIVADKSLSSMAHNIKIVVEGGVATLRGPVSTNDEKAKVDALTRAVHGVIAIDNQLDVKTDFSAK